MRVNTGYINSTRSNPLFLCLCDVLGALINCLVCWFYTGALALALFLVVFNSWRGKRVRSGRDWSQHPESLINSDDVDAFGQDVATRCQMALLRLFPPHSRLLSEFCPIIDPYEVFAPLIESCLPLWYSEPCFVSRSERESQRSGWLWCELLGFHVLKVKSCVSRFVKHSEVDYVWARTCSGIFLKYIYEYLQNIS